MIRFIDISKKYKEKIVFDRFCLTAEKNKITCILGESGSGKTTLLNIAAGLIPYEGKVEANGRFSYIFQEPRLLPNLTVKGNLSLVNKDSYKIQEMLKQVSLEDKIDSYPSKLSGGEKQRVSIARAFLYGAENLLMDEPFSSLDIALKISLMKNFFDVWSGSRRTTLFVTHSVEEALMLSDRIVAIKEGRIIGDFENSASGDYFKESSLKGEIYRLLLGEAFDG